MASPTHGCRLFRNLFTPFCAQLGGTGLSAFLPANSAECYRVGILASIWVFKRSSVEMFAYCLFHNSSGHGYEIVFFA